MCSAALRVNIKLNAEYGFVKDMPNPTPGAGAGGPVVRAVDAGGAGEATFALVPFAAAEFEFFGERRFKTLLRALLLEKPPKVSVVSLDASKAPPTVEPRRWWRVAPESVLPDEHLKAAVRTLNAVLRQRKAGGRRLAGRKKKAEADAAESARKRTKRSAGGAEAETEPREDLTTAATAPRVAAAKAAIATKGGRGVKKRVAAAPAVKAAGAGKKRRRRIVMQSDGSDDDSDDDAFA